MLNDGEANQILESLAVRDNTVAEVERLLQYRLNVILYGSPGTGKTRAAFEIGEHWKARNGIDSVFLVTFHPSYTYEDFVRGYKPLLTSGGGRHLRYAMEYCWMQRRWQRRSRYCLSLMKSIVVTSPEYLVN